MDPNASQMVLDPKIILKSLSQKVFGSIGLQCTRSAYCSHIPPARCFMLFLHVSTVIRALHSCPLWER